MVGDRCATVRHVPAIRAPRPPPIRQPRRRPPKVGGKVTQERIGPLGSVPLSEPIALGDRVRLWARMNQRLVALRERHPGRISAADETKTATIAKRIPRARSEDEFKRFLQATVVHDVVAALERQDAGLDGVREAAKQLAKLMREAQRGKQRPKLEG